MATTKFRLDHTPALDGLRGLAILAVVLFHSSWVSAGYMGVDVFFVLSGFLITCLLLQEWEDHGKIDIAAFYWRRALRLAPALIALILICSAYETLYPACGSSLPLWSRALYAISYFSNWLWALGGPVTASPLCSFYALWSLAIEEQFYLIWPLTVVGLLRRSISKRTLAFAICGVIVSLNAFRLYLWSSGAPYWRIYAGSDTHADPILIGCLLALGVFTLPRSYWRKIRSLVLCCGPLALAGALILMLRLSFPSQSFFHVQFPTIGTLTAIVIIAVTVSPSPLMTSILGSAPLAWIGKLSYGIYLWHSAADYYLQIHFPRCPTLGRIAVALGLAVISYYCLERPFLRLKNRAGAAVTSLSIVPSN